MTRVAALMIVVLSFAVVQAEQTSPSAAVLADMGLADLQILSDGEASAIRGRGFEPGSHLAGFESYELSKLEFQARVGEFRERIKSRSHKGAPGFASSKQRFEGHVTKFHDAVQIFRHKTH